MRAKARPWRSIFATGVAAALLSGCASRQVRVPCGHLPPATGATDSCTAAALSSVPSPSEQSPPTPPATPPDRKPFDLPRDLPGADAPPLRPPNFKADTPPAERERILRDLYPQPESPGPRPPITGQPVSLADLQQMALAGSPAVRRARAEAEGALGPVIQAGLRPNPTVGYQADQWHIGNDNGQQGVLFNKVFKFPGKLSLAKTDAGLDYLNALAADRKDEVEVTTKLRKAYFAARGVRQAVE